MKKKMLNICVFHTEFAYSGGAEKLIFHQMDYLQNKGGKVTCYTAFVDKDNCFPEEITKYDIRQILPTFLNKIIPHDLMIVATTLAFPFYIYLFKKHDIFLGENQAGPWWAFMAAFFWRKTFFTYQSYPTTLTYPREIDKEAKRNTFITDSILKLFKIPIISFDKFVLRKAKVCFANGEYVKKILEKVYGRKFVDCPAGTKLGVFNEKIFKRRYSGSLLVAGKKLGKPYILITNRHFPAKRLDFGIRIMSKLKDQKSNVNLVITGREREYTKKLEKMVKKLRLEKNVTFTGLVSEQEISMLYQNALVYIYTAPEEDFGMGIVEAMSHGAPVVAWDKGGPTGIIKDKETGFLAKPGVLEDFEKKIERLMTNKKLSLKIAQNTYRDSRRYTWENHYRILGKHLNEEASPS